MLYLITGPNGGGKSVLAMRLMEEKLKAGLKVFGCNFNNLRAPGVELFPDPNEWAVLPEGSVLFVDESQDFWPARAMGQKPPETVKRLKIHRQGGIDIYLITQAAKFIDSDIRPLFAGHLHSVAYGPGASRIFKWSECQDDAQSVGARRNGQFEVWGHDRRYYDWFTSATQHLEKPKAPLRQRINKLLFVIAGLLICWVLYQVYDWMTNGTAGAAKASSKPGSSFSMATAFGGKKGRPVTPEEYLRALLPRFPELPYSAPIFDERKPQSDPELYCMSSGEPADSCTCLTEQGTPHVTSLDRCVYMARHGTPYNPFKRPAKTVSYGNRGPGASSSGTSHNGDLRPESVTAVLGSDQVSNYGHFREQTAGATQDPPSEP